MKKKVACLHWKCKGSGVAWPLQQWICIWVQISGFDEGTGPSTRATLSQDESFLTPRPTRSFPQAHAPPGGHMNPTATGISCSLPTGCRGSTPCLWALSPKQTDTPHASTSHWLRCARHPPIAPQTPPKLLSHTRPVQLRSGAPPPLNRPPRAKAKPLPRCQQHPNRCALYLHTLLRGGAGLHPHVIPHRRLRKPGAAQGRFLPPSLLLSLLLLYAAGSQRLRAAPQRAGGSVQKPWLHHDN